MPLTQTLLVLSIQGWECCPSGHSQSAKCSEREGGGVHRELKCYILYSSMLLFYVLLDHPHLTHPPTPNSGLVFMHEKTTATVLEGGPLTPHNMGKCIGRLQVI